MNRERGGQVAKWVWTGGQLGNWCKWLVLLALRARWPRWPNFFATGEVGGKVLIGFGQVLIFPFLRKCDSPLRFKGLGAVGGQGGKVLMVFPSAGWVLTVTPGHGGTKSTGDGGRRGGLAVWGGSMVVLTRRDGGRSTRRTTTTGGNGDERHENWRGGEGG